MNNNKINMELLAKQNRVTEIFISLINTNNSSFSNIFAYEDEKINRFIHKAIEIDNKIKVEVGKDECSAFSELFFSTNKENYDKQQ